MKNFKASNNVETPFESLKNIWRILNHFNSRFDRAAKIIVGCCWLHNYCEMWHKGEPFVTRGVDRVGHLVGFGNIRLPVHSKEERTKEDEKLLRNALFI